MAIVIVEFLRGETHRHWWTWRTSAGQDSVLRSRIKNVSGVDCNMLEYLDSDYTEKEGLILCEMVACGYRLVTSSASDHQNPDANFIKRVFNSRYVFEGCSSDSTSKKLRGDLAALHDRLDHEADARRREAASHSAKHTAMADELRAAQVCFEEGQKKQTEAAIAMTAALAAKEGELACLRRELAQLSDKLSLQQAAQQAALAEAQERNACTQAAFEEENKVLRDRLALTEVTSSAIEEIDLPAKQPGGWLRKQIRLACPGVTADQLDILPLANGVLVQILQVPCDSQHNSGVAPLFSKEFVYHHGDGFFQLCQDEHTCGIENGVLVLELQCVPRPKLKLGRVSRAPLMRIDEGQTPAPQLEEYRLSPSPSLGTLSTVSSSWVVPIDNSDTAAASVDGEQCFGYDSWMSRGGPNCFMPFTLFRMDAKPVHFLPGRDLQSGSRVLAADDLTVVQVVSVVVHKSRELLEIEAGEAKLQVTGNHRIVVPSSTQGIQEGIQDVRATDLQIGDSIICKTKEGGSARRVVTNIVLMLVDDAEEFDVLELTFRPDVPVAVFQEPSEALLTKGFKKKKVRRTLKSKVGRNETLSIPDTAAEYSD